MHNQVVGLSDFSEVLCNTGFRFLPTRPTSWWNTYNKEHNKNEHDPDNGVWRSTHVDLHNRWRIRHSGSGRHVVAPTASNADSFNPEGSSTGKLISTLSLDVLDSSSAHTGLVHSYQS